MNQRLQDGEGADQHRDGTRHFATEVGLHRTGKNKQPIRKTMGRRRKNEKQKDKQTKKMTKKRWIQTLCYRSGFQPTK